MTARIEEAVARVRAPHRSARDPTLVTVAQLTDFDEIIDVRSESEYAEDHVPGAVSCPVLNDAERARVGKLHKQVSSFAAKRTGAALVSANIARHLEHRFSDRPREWRPLVYCWRGGSRSDAMAHVLRQVGWRAGRLEGGYRAYRRAVVEALASAPARIGWRSVCGATGCGKSRLLRALAGAGAQVLDLEELAAHRGSVLGNLPGCPQPSQKMFESRIWHALQGYAADRPVYVEAESRKVGNLRVPEALIVEMWRSPCIALEAPMAVRVAQLKNEYSHFTSDPAALGLQLDCLVALHGHGTIAEWKRMALAGDWDAFIEDMLERHYDPAYRRSMYRHYAGLASALRLVASSADDAEFERLAWTCIAAEHAESAPG
jgi:tRNA 2-selenouridine synthase